MADREESSAGPSLQGGPIQYFIHNEIFIAQNSQCVIENLVRVVTGRSPKRPAKHQWCVLCLPSYVCLIICIARLYQLAERRVLRSPSTQVDLSKDFVYSEVLLPDTHTFILVTLSSRDSPPLPFWLDSLLLPLCNLWLCAWSLVTVYFHWWGWSLQFFFFSLGFMWYTAPIL